MTNRDFDKLEKEIGEEFQKDRATMEDDTAVSVDEKEVPEQVKQDYEKYGNKFNADDDKATDATEEKGQAEDSNEKNAVVSANRQVKETENKSTKETATDNKTQAGEKKTNKDSSEVKTQGDTTKNSATHQAAAPSKDELTLKPSNKLPHPNEDMPNDEQEISADVGEDVMADNHPITDVDDQTTKNEDATSETMSTKNDKANDDLNLEDPNNPNKDVPKTPVKDNPAEDNPDADNPDDPTPDDGLQLDDPNVVMQETKEKDVPIVPETDRGYPPLLTGSPLQDQPSFAPIGCAVLITLLLLYFIFKPKPKYSKIPQNNKMN